MTGCGICARELGGRWIGFRRSGGVRTKLRPNQSGFRHVRYPVRPISVACSQKCQNIYTRVAVVNVYFCEIAKFC